MVEVGHDEPEAGVLLPDEVVDGDADVFEGYVGCGGEFSGADFYCTAFDAGQVAINEEHGDAAGAWAAGADGGHWGRCISSVRQIVNRQTYWIDVSRRSVGSDGDKMYLK